MSMRLLLQQHNAPSTWVCLCFQKNIWIIPLVTVNHGFSLCLSTFSSQSFSVVFGSFVPLYKQQQQQCFNNEMEKNSRNMQKKTRIDEIIYYSNICIYNGYSIANRTNKYIQSVWNFFRYSNNERWCDKINSTNIQIVFVCRYLAWLFFYWCCWAAFCVYLFLFLFLFFAFSTKFEFIRILLSLNCTLVYTQKMHCSSKIMYQPSK